ncbi:MAG: hypothetical protein II955_06820 [Clostridia bacterium]|nr:hypothetical protein [Clostridia bacterium]
MGKGNRNRIGRDDENILARKPAKSKKRRVRRPLPKLLVPIVSAVLVVAIAVAAITVALWNNGTFKRTNILVKSQKSGKYSLNQQAAQVLVWTSVWDQSSQLYNAYSGLAESEFEYCWGQAMNAKYNIREYIGDYYATTLTSLVAACDEGIRTGVEFSKEEQQEAYDSMVSALKSEAYSYYSYLSEAGLSNISPYYVYYTSYPYFGQFLKQTLGNDIKEKDIRRAAVIQAYAGKVYSLKQNEFWETTAENVAAEVKANPEDYYSSEYLTYSTSDAALAAILANTTTAEAFKTAVVTDHVKKNYVALYNKYVTEKTAEVNTTLDAVRGKTTDEELETAMAAQTMAAIVYDDTNADTLPAEVKAWLFPTAEGVSRAKFDATSLTSEDGLKAYVVVVKEVNADAGSVTAAYKEIAYDVLTDENLTKLTNTVLKSLELLPDGVAVYESASEKADAIVAALNAADDKATYLAANGATDAADVTAETDTVPASIRDAIFEDDAASGAVLKVGTQTTVYVVYVSSLTTADGDTPAVAKVSYITVEEKMDDVVSELSDGVKSTLPTTRTASFRKPAAVKAEEQLAKLNAAADKASFLSKAGGIAVTDMTDANHAEKSVPDEVSAAVLADGISAGMTFTANKPDSTVKYVIYVAAVGENGVSFTYLTVSTYEAGSYMEWLFGSVDRETMTGGAAVGTTFKKDPAEGETDYEVYLAVGAIKKDTEAVVRGGYVSFDSESEAETALNSLAGLSGYTLLNRIAELGSDAVSSNLIRSSAVEGELNEWLFSEARTANETAVVKVLSEDGSVKKVYVAAFLQKLDAWESSARSNYASDCAGDWLDGVVAEHGYSVSERALKRVKNPKQPASNETTEDTTAAG